MPWRSAPGRVAALGLIMAAVCALLLAVPGQSATAKYVNDLFIFLDGAHRVVSGQVPNRDFHTVLGPLVYWIPGIGLLITGSLGAAMPMGMALLIAAVRHVLQPLRLGAAGDPARHVPAAATRHPPAHDARRGLRGVPRRDPRLHEGELRRRRARLSRVPRRRVARPRLAGPCACHGGGGGAHRGA